jgi:hypothetical protein
MSDPVETRSGARTFFATALIVIGLLWMALTGLCTASVAISTLLQGDPLGFLGAVPVLLVIGALCIGPGWLIWLAGKALRGRRNDLQG